MNAAGIGATTMLVSKQAVTDKLLTEPEYTALMDTFKSALPADVVKHPRNADRDTLCWV